MSELLSPFEIEITTYEDESIDLAFGTSVPKEYEEQVVKSFEINGFEEAVTKSNSTKTVFKQKRWTLEKTDDLPYWHPKAQMLNAKRVREAQRTAIVKPTAPVSVPTKIDPSSLGDGSGRKYADIKDRPLKKDELDDKIKSKIKGAMDQRNFGEAEATRHVIDRDRGAAAPKPEKQLLQSESVKFDPNGQWSLDKSNYGPKGAGAYDAHVNQERKKNNVDNIDGLGVMGRVKDYGHSDPRRADAEQAKIRSLNRKQPVKVFTDEEKKAYQAQLEAKPAKVLAQSENATLVKSQFENMVKSDSQNYFQPSNEELFGQFVVSEEAAKAADQQWNGTFNSFFGANKQPVEKQDLSKSWGSRGPISKETMTEEERKISEIPVNPALIERD